MKTIKCLLLFFCCLSLMAEVVPVRAQVVLDEVYQEIAKRHYDSGFAENYRKHYLQHQPAILKSGNDRELAENINAMLRDFGDSHLYLQPPLSSALSQASRGVLGSAGEGPVDSGIELLETGEGIVVLRVKADSPAADAGVKSGMIVRRINGLDILPDGSPMWLGIARQLLMISGWITLTVQDGDKQNTVEFTPERETQPPIQLPGGPLLRGSYFSELRSDNIAYIHFNWFTMELIREVRGDIRGKLKDAAGLIIDLRGNGGGTFNSIDWLGGWTLAEPVSFGTLNINRIPLKLSSTPQARGFKKKVAVLIDRNSFSAAEIFAAGVQDAKAGRIYGTTSGGQCLPSMFVALPSGFRLQTLIGAEKRASGGHIEKVGVTPDVIVEATSAGLLDGKDAVIEKAAADLLAD